MSALETLDPASQVALVTYAAAVSVFDLTQRDVHCANVVSGSSMMGVRARASLTHRH